MSRLLKTAIAMFLAGLSLAILAGFGLQGELAEQEHRQRYAAIIESELGEAVDESPGQSSGVALYYWMFAAAGAAVLGSFVLIGIAGARRP